MRDSPIVIGRLCISDAAHGGTALWCDDIPVDKSWSTLWSDYILCGHCQGIRRVEGSCSVCGNSLSGARHQTVRLHSGQDVVFPANVYAGAEGRYEDWIYLRMPWQCPQRM